MTSAFSRSLSRALSRSAPAKLALSAALALSATLASFAVTAAPAQAAARSGQVVVSLASPLAQPTREIVDGVLWRCEGDRCTGTVDGSRPVRVCGRVAKKFGPVASYASPEGVLAAEDLTRCNTAK